MSKNQSHYHNYLISCIVGSKVAIQLNTKKEVHIGCDAYSEHNFDTGVFMVSITPAYNTVHCDRHFQARLCIIYMTVH